MPKHGYPRRVLDDLDIINHFSAQGELSEGLRRVTTKFVVVHLRGIQFKISGWSQRQRRDMRKQIFVNRSLLLDKPIYSYAVYERAGIRDFADFSEITLLKLEKTAFYLYHQYLNFVQSEELRKAIHSDKTLTEIKQLVSCPSSISALKIQQLYTVNYVFFHDRFLRWAYEKGYISSMRNPFVSMSDIDSQHAYHYAYGNKNYGNQKDRARLRPKYQTDGKPLRPYSGFNYMTIQPLTDLVRGDHHHILSLIRLGYLNIGIKIAPEAECTFFTKVDSERVKYFHMAKFPSFQNDQFLASYPLAYALEERHYFKFKNLISTTAPHSHKRKLVIYLLALYQSAYNQLYLLSKAYEKTTSKGKEVLVFRDSHGNFSLRPTFDHNAFPNGSDEPSMLTNFSMFSLKRNKGKGKVEVIQESDHEVEMSGEDISVPTEYQEESGDNQDDQSQLSNDDSENEDESEEKKESPVEKIILFEDITGKLQERSEYKIDGDGNCLFKALAEGINSQLGDKVIKDIIDSLQKLIGTGMEVKEITHEWLRHAAIKKLNQMENDDKTAEILTGELENLLKDHHDDTLEKIDQDDENNVLVVEFAEAKRILDENKETGDYHLPVNAHKWAKLYRDLIAIPGIWSGDHEIKIIEEICNVRLHSYANNHLGHKPRELQLNKLKKLIEEKAELSPGKSYNEMAADELKQALISFATDKPKKALFEAKLYEKIQKELAGIKKDEKGDLDEKKLEVYLDSDSALKLYYDWYLYKPVIPKSCLEEPVYRECLLDKYAAKGLTRQKLKDIEANYDIRKVYFSNVHDAAYLQEVPEDRRIIGLYTGSHYNLSQPLKPSLTHNKTPNLSGNPQSLLGSKKSVKIPVGLSQDNLQLT